MSGLLVAASVDPTTLAQSRPLTERLLVAAAQILGLSLVAAGVAAVVALLYRWYVRERVPGGLPALFGLGAIVPFLGTSQLLRNVMTPDGSPTPIDEATALFNIAAFLVALGATRLGTDVGDRLGSDVAVATGERAVEAEVSRVVQAVGRVITVELPEEVGDIVGYDPVPEETKESLAGKTFVFPRRLTVDELRERLVTRLKADYAVGHVDLELAGDGSVEYLAVGSRAAGIGPTLPPETSAVAVQADPAFAASAGDLVQVWRRDPFERVLTAEVRGTVGDTVTLAIDAADTRKLDAETDYRLVTLPVETRPDREFASVLRAAEETMAAVTVAEGSALAGQPLGAIDVTVVAVRPAEGPVEALPARDRRLSAGDALYVVAMPEAIRKVELGAAPPRDAGGDPGAPSTDSGARLAPDDRVDATTPVAGESLDDPGPAAAESRAAASRDGDRRADESGDDDAEQSDPSDPLANLGGDGSSEPGDAGRSTDSAVDDLSDEDAPGIRALEDESGESDERSESETGAAAESQDREPTRDDIEDLSGTDVADLTGTDVTVDGVSGEDDEAAESESDGEREGPDSETDEAADAGEADGDADGGKDADGDDAEPDDAAGGDDGGWSVAVDQRRDDDR